MAASSGARLQRKAARTAVSAASAHSFRRCYGIQFTTPGAGGSAVPLIKEAIANGELFRAHAFELACARNDIEHRTTKAKHPWTNGQVERMNRTIKDATVKRFYYESHDQLRQHLADFSRLQLWPQAQDPQGPHAVRIHLPTVDKEPEPSSSIRSSKCRD